MTAIDPIGNAVQLYGALVAGILSCAAAGYFLLKRYGDDPQSDDKSNFRAHCLTNCMITTYMPWCVVILPWGSECIGFFDWSDIGANLLGIECGLANGIGIMSAFERFLPYFMEDKCKRCCEFKLRLWGFIS